MNKPEIIISTDVETLGTVAGIHPMIHVGSVAIDQATLLEIDAFSVNLKVPEDLKIDPDTLEWWKHPTRAEAWQRVTTDPQDPAIGMKAYRAWLDKLAEEYTLAFMAKPEGFDHSFVSYYLMRFTGSTPFLKARGYDIHTLISAFTGKPVTEVHIGYLPAELRGEGRPNHVGIDEARYQGMVGCALLNLFHGAAAKADEWMESFDDGLDRITTSSKPKCKHECSCQNSPHYTAFDLMADLIESLAPKDDPKAA